MTTYAYITSSKHTKSILPFKTKPSTLIFKQWSHPCITSFIRWRQYNNGEGAERNIIPALFWHQIFLFILPILLLPFPHRLLIPSHQHQMPVSHCIYRFPMLRPIKIAWTRHVIHSQKLNNTSNYIASPIVRGELINIGCSKVWKIIGVVALKRIWTWIISNTKPKPMDYQCSRSKLRTKQRNILKCISMMILVGMFHYDWFEWMADRDCYLTVLYFVYINM